MGASGFFIARQKGFMTTENSLGGPAYEEVNLDEVAAAPQPETAETTTVDEQPISTTWYGQEPESGAETPAETPSEGDGEADWENSDELDPRDPSVLGTEPPDQVGGQVPQAPQQPQPPQPYVDPQVAQRLYQENVRLQQQQFATAAEQKAMEYARSVYQDAINQGWLPEHAQQRALDHRDLMLQRIGQLYQEYQTQGQQAQVNARYWAQTIGQRLGVDPNELLGYNSAQQMFQAAQGIARERARATSAVQEAAQLRRSRVPAQHYNQPGQPRGGKTYQQWLDDYAKGSNHPQALAAGKKLQQSS